MNSENLEKMLRDALAKVAPELKNAAIDGSVALQDQLDLDSVDILNYVIQLQRDLHIDVPNQDFQYFLKWNDALAYLAKRVAGGPLQTQESHSELQDVP
jgi:acyl carrier protein